MNPIHFIMKLSIEQAEQNRRRMEMQRRLDYEEMKSKEEEMYKQKRDRFYKNLRREEEEQLKKEKAYAKKQRKLQRQQSGNHENPQNENVNQFDIQAFEDQLQKEFAEKLVSIVKKCKTTQYSSSSNQYRKRNRASLKNRNGAAAEEENSWEDASFVDEDDSFGEKFDKPHKQSDLKQQKQTQFDQMIKSQETFKNMEPQERPQTHLTLETNVTSQYNSQLVNLSRSNTDYKSLNNLNDALQQQQQKQKVESRSQLKKIDEVQTTKPKNDITKISEQADHENKNTSSFSQDSQVNKQQKSKNLSCSSCIII